jgi:hypothetical protein
MASPSVHDRSPHRGHLRLIVNNPPGRRSRLAPFVGTLTGTVIGCGVGVVLAGVTRLAWPTLGGDLWPLLLPIVWAAAAGAVLGWLSVALRPARRPRRSRRPRARRVAIRVLRTASARPVSDPRRHAVRSPTG